MAYNDVPYVELWRRCLKWLTKLKLIEQDDPINEPSSTVTELQNRLRNGVLLCNLLKMLRKDLQEKYDFPSGNTQKSKYIWQKNNQLFLKICEQEFQFIYETLFRPDDLVHFMNFDLVLSTLAELSQTEWAKELAEPFSVKEEDSKEKYPSERYFQSQQEDDEDNESIVGIYHTYGIPSMEEEFEQSANHYRDKLELAGETETLLEIPLRAQHGNIFEPTHFDLIKSEKYYLETLMIGEKIAGSLNGILGKEEIKEIFNNFSKLISLHTNVYQDFCSTYPNDLLNLKFVFDKYRLEFLIYLEYCSKYRRNYDTFKNFKRGGGITANEIKNIEKEYGGIEIEEHILSQPYYRIQFYIKKVQVLLNKSDSSEVQYSFVESRKILIKLANLTGASVSDEEFMNSFTEEKFSDFHKMPEKIRNFTECGRVIHDDNIKLAKHGSTKIYNGWIFIFEEVIIIYKLKKPFLKLVSEIFQKKEEERDQFHYLQTLYPSQINPCIVANHHIKLNQDQKDVHPFTLDAKVTSDSVVIIPLTQHRQNDLKRMITKAIHIQIYKQIGNRFHTFQIKNLPMENFQENVFCNLCDNFLLGRYGQCYECQTCKIKCHSYCMLVVDQVDCHFENREEHPIVKPNWWKGEMSRKESQTHFEYYSEPHLFMVRWSSTTSSPVLSVCDVYGEVKNIMIDSKPSFSFRNSKLEISFQTLSSLIAYFSENNIYTSVPEVDAYLHKVVDL